MIGLLHEWPSLFMLYQPPGSSATILPILLSLQLLQSPQSSLSLLCISSSWNPSSAWILLPSPSSSPPSRLRMAFYNMLLPSLAPADFDSFSRNILYISLSKDSSDKLLFSCFSHQTMSLLRARIVAVSPSIEAGIQQVLISFIHLFDIYLQHIYSMPGKIPVFMELTFYQGLQMRNKCINNKISGTGN